MMRVWRTTLLALASAAIVSQAQSAGAEELTVMATGGAWQAALRQAFKILFREGLTISNALARIEKELPPLPEVCPLVSVRLLNFREAISFAGVKNIS